MINPAEDVCNEEHIYFYYLSLELIFYHHQFFCHIYLQYFYIKLTAYHD